MKEKPFIKLHCVLGKDIFKLLYFFSLKAHEIVKLPIIKDPSKYLKCKIYFTFFSPRCYNVNKNMEKWKVSGVIIATTV